MALAKRLHLGDTIAFFSPSSPITVHCPTRFERSKNFMRQKGFKLYEGNLTMRDDYYRSGTILDRAKELNELIYMPEVKCIMSTIGGMNSNSILPYVDYDYLSKNPKIIIGHSDVTALLIGIYAMTGLITFHGPALVPNFGEFSPFSDRTYEYFEAMVADNTSIPYEIPVPPVWTEEYIPWDLQERQKTGVKNELITVNSGTATGRLIGGNLNTMQGFLASKYFPKIKDGDILYLEDSMKDISTIERSFSMLKVSGIFEKVGGIILGKHELFDDGFTGRKPYNVLLEVISNLSVPILAEFDCGHTHPTLTLPIGAKVTLDATKQKLTLMENCCC